jgi:hypothetical protein
VPAFDEVGDEHEDRVTRPGDERLAVGDRLVDVGAAAELGAKEDIDRVRQFSVRSTTAVSNTASEVFSARIEATTAPKADAYTTEDAMDPDWSIARTTSRATTWWRRPYPAGRSGITVRCSGR